MQKHSLRTDGKKRVGDPKLAARLNKELEGNVLFDKFSRGRYSTDASIYQIEPIGTVVPMSNADVERTINIAKDEGIPILPRGGGTSQCGQVLGEALIIDTSKQLNRILEFDAETKTIEVEPGVVLDDLNRMLKPHKLFFPVDISTGSRATIGGMAGNNACGSRSIRYGNMVHNVLEIDAILADGTKAHFGQVSGNLEDIGGPRSYLDIISTLRKIAARESDEIDYRYPNLLRNVGGYNINTIKPEGHNLAQLLVGSEGTLAYFQKIKLPLQSIPLHRVLGICLFPTLRSAMETVPGIVQLDASAVELVDRTMIDLANENPVFRPAIDQFLKGNPAAILLVEFSGDEEQPLLEKLTHLHELLRDLNSSVEIIDALDPGFQAEVWEVRKSGLNILMAMRGDGKPVSFIEDCAVPLEHLADYTDRLNEEFDRHGVQGTWYAHASVGTLHVRPVLNMKDPKHAIKMREIAEFACATVKELKGAFSGEHGDGLVRSEFIEKFYGPRLTQAFKEIKEAFDPDHMLNPGKIVDPPRMDERSLFRFGPDYKPGSLVEALDWSEFGGFLRASEMCNNNGHCRKSEVGVMCPSYRATREEVHLTRGRANTLRLALSGQLGKDALVSDMMKETMDLCIGCKGCRRECPTGVDMSRLKLEFLHHYNSRHGQSLRNKLISHLPRYAPTASKFGQVLNGFERIPGTGFLREAITGFSRHRSLPHWHRKPYFGLKTPNVPTERSAYLFVDCFNRWFEPENARAAESVLKKLEYEVIDLSLPDDQRPLCCGRTFLSVGMIEEARKEAKRLIEAIRPALQLHLPIIGLEPSCLLTLRDEFKVLFSKDEISGLEQSALMFHEFIANNLDEKPNSLQPRDLKFDQVMYHGHCHEKAFGLTSDIERVLEKIPGIEVKPVPGGCCGMAGSFGYEAEHYEMSKKIGNVGPLPHIRGASKNVVIVANGTSCRHQFNDLAGKKAVHLSQIVDTAL